MEFTHEIPTVAATADGGGEPMPWENHDFVPRYSSGKQKTPNTIRNALRRHIEESDDRTQKSFVEEMGVGTGSFNYFMNAKNFSKNQWAAAKNETYLAAGRLLAKAEHEKKLLKKTAAVTGKRKAAPPSDNNIHYDKENAIGPLPAKTPKVTTRVNFADFMASISGYDTTEDVTTVYDSCPEILKKIKAFLAQDGVTKKSFCLTLGNLNNNSLNRFMAGKKQAQAGNITYQRAYTFFEKKRLLEQEPKSKARIKNESEQGPEGFSTKVKTGRPPARVYVKLW